MIIILPWLQSKDDFWNFIAAIFPIKRGLYQLKVTFQLNIKIVGCNVLVHNRCCNEMAKTFFLTLINTVISFLYFNELFAINDLNNFKAKKMGFHIIFIQYFTCIFFLFIPCARKNNSCSFIANDA